jgi:ADP-heptose:LPS heptosyltransferase
MSAPKHILVMRFSAMGDVAMTVPVISELLQQNPDLHITYLSRAQFAGIFTGLPRFTFISADINGRHKGFRGLVQLFNEAKKTAKFDHVADLHNSLRTRVLRNLFRLIGVPVKVIDKGRDEKKLLTRFPGKVLKPLKRTTERYADVFRKAGFSLQLSYQLKSAQKVTNPHFGEKTQPWIGISPFAKHKGKIYPLNHMEEVLAQLNHGDVRLFLFSGAGEEKQICEDWADKFGHVTTVNGLNLQQEIELIGQLDVMLSMDSAGMHLASIAGTPVVSVWGATHHYAGFLGYGQSENNIVADDIECRPCSIYGNKPCFRGDYACLYNITPKQIADKLQIRLKN